MSTSAAVYLGKGFWVDDALLSLWMHFMASEVAAEKEPPAWLADLRDHWLRMISIGGGAVLDLGFESHLSNDARRQVIRKLNESVKQRLVADGTIPIEELQRAQVGGTIWLEGLRADNVLKVARTIDILLGSEPDELAFYPIITFTR